MKIGDKVRFLSEVGGGIVTGFQGKDFVLVENADAMIRFGRYTTVLKKRVPFNLRRTSENHAPSTSDKIICGTKHMIHNNRVFLV